MISFGVLPPTSLEYCFLAPNHFDHPIKFLRADYPLCRWSWLFANTRFPNSRKINRTILGPNSGALRFLFLHRPKGGNFSNLLALFFVLFLDRVTVPSILIPVPMKCSTFENSQANTFSQLNPSPTMEVSITNLTFAIQSFRLTSRKYLAWLIDAAFQIRSQ